MTIEQLKNTLSGLSEVLNHEQHSRVVSWALDCAKTGDIKNGAELVESYPEHLRQEVGKYVLGIIDWKIRCIKRAKLRASR